MSVKFKVGDKVICIGVETATEEHESGFGGYGWRLGRTFRICRISDSNDFRGDYIYWDCNDDVGVYEHHLKLYEKKKIEVYGIVKFMDSITRC